MGLDLFDGLGNILAAPPADDVETVQAMHLLWEMYIAESAPTGNPERRKALRLALNKMGPATASEGAMSDILPSCMMPDGGEACPGYYQKCLEIERLRKENERLRASRLDLDLLLRAVERGEPANQLRFLAEDIRRWHAEAERAREGE